MYRIDELAKISKISSRTLRHYDDIGLLKAKRDSENKYRYYDDNDIDKLQDILFYKELGFLLKDIKKLLEGKLNRLTELEKQLEFLNNEKCRYELLIANITKTIKSVKGGSVMSANEKFEGFKQNLVNENDKNYKEEVVSKWGETNYNKSKDSFLNMSEKDYNKFVDLDSQIKANLLKAFKEGNDPTSEAAQLAAKQHQEWIKMSWGYYNEEAHLNLVEMYLQDQRFKEHYDSNQDGLALLLKNALYELLLK
ncbi:MAG: MerR family transcriptional regulator [Bacilli bacterium]